MGNTDILILREQLNIQVEILQSRVKRRDPEIYIYKFRCFSAYGWY